jgi:hypothetical protein
VEPSASPSCPRCGAGCRAGEARCGRCGFAFFDAAEPRLPGRPDGRGLGPRPHSRLLGLRRSAAGAVAVGISAVAAAILLIAGGDAPPPAPAEPRAPTPVPALEAERRLELRYGGPSDDETAAVRCPGRIAPGRTTRCELRYRDGIARALLVRLSAGGELEADVPYPATLRR